MLRDDRHLPSSSPSMWRELSLHYNGGTTNVMADCRHTKTLGELLSQTLFANHPSPRGAEGSVLKEIESRYRCESSDGIAVSFSLPTHLVPGELYLSVKGGGQHALIGSEVPSTTSAIPATTTRGRGRGRGRGGRGPGRRKRVEEEAEMENGENSEPSENEASSEASDEDDDDESSAAESAEEEQNGGNKRGRGRGAGRGRGRGRPPATVRGKTTTTAAAAAAAGAKRASSSPVAATAPQMMMIQQGMIEVPMKRKRGRPPKNPPMMLVPATEAMLAAAAAAAASSSSSSTRATAARRRGAVGALDTARATSGEATVDATSAWLDSVSHEDGHASSFPSSPTTTSAMRERHTRGGDAESLAAVGRRGRAAAADRDGSPASSSVSAGPSKGHLPPMMDVAEVLRPVRPPPPQRRITATVNCFVREVDGDEVDGVAMHRAEVGRLTTKTVAQQHALFDDALEMKRLQPWSTPLHDEDASSGDPLWAPSLLREESDESSSASSSTTSSAVQAILSTEEAPNTAAVSAAALWQKQGLTPSFMLADANSFLAMPQLCLMDPPTTTTSSTTNVAMKKEEHHQRVSTMAATASWPGHDGCPTSITIPIIVGGCVRLINNESKDRSHRWTVYVRGLHAGFPVASGPNTSATTTTTTTLTNKNDVEDESDYLHRFVDSVTFILDRSFSPCVRTVSSPPFELTEEGWGEFVVSIHVHLRYPVASGSRKAERQRRQLDGFMCGSGGRATLLCSTGPGRAVNALDPITSMNVVSSVCGRGIHTNAQTNADNALVDGLLDINYNSAARSLLYRGPWLPPFLSEDADDDDEEEAMMYGRRRTTPAARRGIQPDGGVVPASPSPSPSSSSPSITSHIIGNASYVNAFLNPTAAVAAAATAASSTSAFPAQPSSSLSSFSSPATTDANANAPSSPHTNTNNNNNTPGSPNAGKRLIASLSRGHSDDVVVLSHLLRFSHRPKPPVLVPPLMDVRGAHLRGEHVATGYALVSEPVVSEQYDEIYIPIDVCDLQEDDDDDDGATRTKLEAEASGHGMKKEDKDDDDEERGIRAGHRRRGRYSRKTAMLLREAGVMERQLRAYLHRHIATGGRELAAVYHHPECCTIKGGVSCWPQIVQHGDAATKDALLTVAFLKSLTATASVEGWLHRALDLHEVAHEHEDGPHTAVGGVLPGPALITKLEFQLATQMMRQHSSRAAMAMFYRDVLPQAVSVGAMVWQAVSAANAVVASAPMHSGSSDGAGGGGGGGGADVGTPSSSSSPPTSQQTGGRGVDFALYPLAAELTTPLPVGGANHITAAGRGRGGGGVAPGHHLGAHHHQHHAHHTNTPPYHLLCQQPLPNTFANGEKSTNFGHDGDMDRLVQMKEALMSSIAEMREEVARRQAICAFETM